MIRALLAGGLAAILAACSPPRSESYFAAHRAQADRVVADCRTGAHRGRECDTAKAALAALKRDERIDLYKQSF